MRIAAAITAHAICATCPPSTRIGPSRQAGLLTWHHPLVIAFPDDLSSGIQSISAFLRSAKSLCLFVSAQFRTQNRFPLLLELLQYDDRPPHSVGHVPEFHRLPDSPIEDGHLTDLVMLVEQGRRKAVHAAGKYRM